MTREEFDTLRLDEVRRAVAENLGRDPLRVALDRRVPHAALVATQVKYLDRARTKLPACHAARCILPPRAFEQASSEACAAHKGLSGDSVLDLTCGLGIDAAALARNFRRVVTLERDPVLADITAYNLRLLGITNVEVRCIAAEEYLAHCCERFDWVYADPDRRDTRGERHVRLEDCSPNILELREPIRRLGARLCVKNSPLFDASEALRLFPRGRIEAVSLGGECKELVIYDDDSGPLLAATAIGIGSAVLDPAAEEPPQPERFDRERYRWLFLPDVALQKVRIVRRVLAGKADAWSENGFAFAAMPVEGVAGRNLEIEAVEPLDWRTLRRELQGCGVEIFKRDFPMQPDEIRHRMSARPGSDRRLAFTRIGGKSWTIKLK